MQKIANQYLGSNLLGTSSVEHLVQQIATMLASAVKEVERSTGGQPSSSVWKEHCIGRITSSFAHWVSSWGKTLQGEKAKLKPQAYDPESCIQLFMRENQQDVSRIPQVKYGITTEPDAKAKSQTRKS